MTGYSRPAHISVKHRDDFFYAVRDGDFAAVRTMLDDDFPINTPDGVGESALMWACRHQQKGMAHLLIEEGIDIHAAPPNGVQAICYATAFLPGLAKELVKAGADVNVIPSDRSWTPLLKAIEVGNNDLAQYLIDNGADVNALDGSKQPALMVAALHNHAMFRPLLNAGAVLDQDGPESMLHRFLYSHPIKTEQALDAILLCAGAGADVHRENKYYGPLPELAGKQKAKLKPTIERICEAPQVTADALENATLQSLFANEKSLLDNPQAWWRLDELLTQLASKGEAMEIGRLQSGTAPDQQTYLEYGIRCAGFGHVREVLNKHGMPIIPNKLVDDQGQQTPLLKAVVASGEVKAIFCTDYWQDHPLPELKRVYAALEENVREEIPYHQLVQWKSKQERLARESAREM